LVRKMQGGADAAAETASDGPPPAKKRGKVFGYVHPDDVQFVWVPDRDAAEAHRELRKFCRRGLVSEAWLEHVEQVAYVGLTDEEAAARLPDDWLCAGRVDVRTVPFKHAARTEDVLARFWKGILPEEIVELERAYRIRNMAKRLGWKYGTGGYRRLERALAHAVHVCAVPQATLDTDDAFLWSFSRHFRILELAHDAVHSIRGIYFYEAIVPQCLGKEHTATWVLGMPLLQRYEARQRDIGNWRLLAAKCLCTTGVQHTVAHCLFAPAMPQV
jgi:hypothetical protein